MLIGGKESYKMIRLKGKRSNFIVYIIFVYFYFYSRYYVDIANKLFRSFRYFPANYVAVDALEARGSTPTEPPEIIGLSPKKEGTPAASTNLGRCVALFTYASDEPGDLSFEAGETIVILKKV